MAATRLGQAAYEFTRTYGDAGQATGYLGDALLRLYGVKLALKEVPRGKPALPPPVDDVRWSNVNGLKGAIGEHFFVRGFHAIEDLAILQWGKYVNKQGNNVIGVNWRTGD